jgi:hypothetical protein
MHSLTRLIMDRHIHSKMSGQLRIVWQASTVRCASSLSTGAAYTGVFRCPHRIQIWRGAWRSCSGSSSTYPSVMIGVTENIFHSVAKMCKSTTTHAQYSFSYNSQIKYCRTHADMDIFTGFGRWNSWPKVVHTFQSHPVFMKYLS